MCISLPLRNKNEEIEEELINAQDSIVERADSLVDPYTSDLLDWYSNDVNRIAYMNDAIKELEAQDGFQVLSGGQFLYWEEVLNEVIEVALELIQSMKDNETEEDEEE